MQSVGLYMLAMTTASPLVTLPGRSWSPGHAFRLMQPLQSKLMEGYFMSVWACMLRIFSTVIIEELTVGRPSHEGSLALHRGPYSHKVIH